MRLVLLVRAGIRLCTLDEAGFRGSRIARGRNPTPSIIDQKDGWMVKTEGIVRKEVKSFIPFSSACSYILTTFSPLFAFIGPE
jgi:hypothetical protein